MLEAHLDKAITLKRIVDALKDLVDVCYLNCSQGGITIKAIDSGYIALVNLVLNEDGFRQYQCPEPVVLGVNIKSLHKILKCAGSDDSAILRCDTDEAETLSIIFTSERSHRTSSFTMRLLEIDTRQFTIPETQFEATVCISSTLFQKIVRDMGSLDNSMTISVSKKNPLSVVFSTGSSSKRDDNSDGAIGEVRLIGDDNSLNDLAEDSDDEKGDDDMPVIIECSNDVSLSFSTRYLLLFTKATQLSRKVLLQLASGTPIQVIYKIESIGHVSYALAPKVDNEESDSEDDDDKSNPISDDEDGNGDEVIKSGKNDPAESSDEI